MPPSDLKKGSTELLILALLEARPGHGYDVARRLGLRTRGVVKLSLAALYPLLYRMESRGWIAGRWIEKPGERRTRQYRLTPAGRKALASQRSTWEAFVVAVNRVVAVRNA
jgi:transcriptional regulator